jgi:Putative peptidoglycan binding domain
MSAVTRIGTYSMKTKAFGLALLMTLAMALPAFAQRRVVTTASGGRTVVANHFHRPFHCGGGGVSWSIGIGFPFYGGYYSSYPYYGGYGGYYPYGGYGYGYYPYGGYSYRASYYGGTPYYGRSYGRPVYEAGYRDSTVARVQERLARAGYYLGAIDGVIGPRTRSAIRAYERRHGLRVDGAIDRQLLATMGLA